MNNGEKDGRKEEGDDEDMEGEEKTEFRGIVAR